jgi:hypothetical protein
MSWTLTDLHCFVKAPQRRRTKVAFIRAKVVIQAVQICRHHDPVAAASVAVETLALVDAGWHIS